LFQSFHDSHLFASKVAVVSVEIPTTSQLKWTSFEVL
jgi:hypothetical protein